MSAAFNITCLSRIIHSTGEPWGQGTYRRAGFFRGPIIYFRELLTEANFAKNIFAIRSKPDYTHVGALREEGVAPKISRNMFSRLAEIREIRENKCPLKNPAIR